MYIDSQIEEKTTYNGDEMRLQAPRRLIQRSHHKYRVTEQNHKDSRTSWRSSDHNEKAETKMVIGMSQGHQDLTKQLRKEQCKEKEIENDREGDGLIDWLIGDILQAPSTVSGDLRA